MSKIVFIGHSVVKGVGYGGVTAIDTFAHRVGLANGYAAADILNKSVSSDTSSGVLARVPTDVIAHSPGVCVVMVGVNDWSTNVPLATFKANLSGIVSAVKSAGIKCVLFTDNANRGTAAQFATYYSYIETIKEVAFEKDCPIVDLYGRMCQQMVVGDHASLYVDSIHLSVAGHQFVASYAAKPWHAGFFVADPPPPIEGHGSSECNLKPLVVAIAEHLVSVCNPSLMDDIASGLESVR